MPAKRKRVSRLLVSQELVEQRIFLIRGHRVILDFDLAKIYGVPTKVFNQAVKRNRSRFPDDFAFRLTPQEAEVMRSQFVTASKRNIRYLPYVFTEHGAIMAANVLNSPRAVQMSVFVVRVFVKLRGYLATNKALADKLEELERKLTDRLDVHEKAILHILEEIKKLMIPPPAEPEKPKRRADRTPNRPFGAAGPGARPAPDQAAVPVDQAADRRLNNRRRIGFHPA